MSRRDELRKIILLALNVVREEIECENKLLCVVKKKRSCWIRSTIEMYGTCGHFETVYRNYFINEPNMVRRMLRMSKECFEELLLKVTPHIEKQDTVMRLAIRPAKRLAITLIFLASGIFYILK